MGELVEVKTTWGRLGIGHILLKDNRKWTVVDAATPAQYEYGRSNWLKVEAPNGETHSIPPKPVTKQVVVLVDPDADPIPPVSHVHGSREADLLVAELGAVEIATRDEATGEIWCPWTEGVTNDHGESALLHLRVAHNIDTHGMETAKQRAEAHGKAHDSRYPTFGKGGFAHRHVPEDLSIV